MVFSWREVLKFFIFVVLVAAVAFYVVSNREHLPDSLTAGSPDQPIAVPPGADQLDEGSAATPESQAGSGDGSSSGAGASPDGEILSVGAFEQGALSAIPASGEADLFVEFRLEREQARSRQLDLLREILDNTNVDGAARSEAMTLWLEITKNIAAEIDLENLIRAKGFTDAVAVLGDGRATIMVKAASLTREEVVRVADLAVRVAGLSYDDITVMARGD